MSFVFDGHECLDAASVAAAAASLRAPAADWYGVANSYTCPLTLTRPGRAVLLMDRGSVDELELEKVATLEITDDDDNRLKISRLIVTRITAATPGTEADADTAYAVELHDRRWLLRRSPTVGRSYNVRATDTTAFMPATLNPADSSAWTWEKIGIDLWQKVFDNAGAAGVGTVGGDQWPGLPTGFTPDATPENFCYHAWSAAAALDDFLARLACAVKYNPLSGAFSIVRLGQAPASATTALPDPDKILDKLDSKTHDLYPVESDTMRYPETIRVVFLALPLLPGGITDCRTVDVAVPVTAQQVNRGTIITLWDDLTAKMSSNMVTNSTALTTRATERMNDWYRKRKYADRPAVQTFPGAWDVSKVLGSNYGRVAWEERDRGVMTSVADASEQTLERWTRSCACCPCTTGPTTTTTAASCGVCAWTWNDSTHVWTAGASTCSGTCICPYPPNCGDNQACLTITVNCIDKFGGQTGSTSTSTTTTPNCATTSTSTTSGGSPTPSGITGSLHGCCPYWTSGPNVSVVDPFTTCNGFCNWVCDGANWIVANSTCGGSCFFGGDGNCRCVLPPTASGTCSVVGQCASGCCGGTTTTTPACAALNCIWRCHAGPGYATSPGVWTLDTACGAGCCCPKPTYGCCYSWQTSTAICVATGDASCSTTPPVCPVTTTTGGCAIYNCVWTCNGAGTGYTLTTPCPNGGCGCLFTLGGAAPSVHACAPASVDTESCCGAGELNCYGP